MASVEMLMSIAEESEAVSLLEKRTKRNNKISKRIGSIAIFAGMSLIVNIPYDQQVDVLEQQTYAIFKAKKPTKYKERTKGDLTMATHKDSNEMSVIMKNLNSNPFFKPSNMDLLKEIKIKGHVKSEVPHLPIESLNLKDAHLLKGDNTI